jgi:hypothetical protein
VLSNELQWMKKEVVLSEGRKATGTSVRTLGAPGESLYAHLNSLARATCPSHSAARSVSEQLGSNVGGTGFVSRPPQQREGSLKLLSLHLSVETE